ncbi:MAG: DUF4968 domain-containing protein [Prevotella sp.]|nr:alpha-glucosidase domain-containing protein [Prevotella sp.]MCH4183084.1 DUF4968 domain-containing protein [Prevotella sp.]MCH4211410.1 DUF4968 domain-containing protein [Prevotella sp.]MCH4240429.1 DUF4968 domain-containing protein [Prevotella sp.]
MEIIKIKIRNFAMIHYHRTKSTKTMKKLFFFLIILLYSHSLHAMDARPHLQFVTPSIVRVQWAADGKLHRNNTGVCIYTPQQVKVKVIDKDSKVFFITSELIVEMDKKTKALAFRDRNTGNVLLEEDHVKPYEAEPVVQQRINYDDAIAHQQKIMACFSMQDNRHGSFPGMLHHQTFILQLPSGKKVIHL